MCAWDNSRNWLRIWGFMHRFQAPWGIRCRRWKIVCPNPIVIAALLVQRRWKGR